MTEARTLAEAAGFQFPDMAHYVPVAPEFDRMGNFALYMACCVQEALSKHPHASSSYRRFADPISSLVSGLCGAERDGDTVLLGLKGVSLALLIEDVLEASLIDTDQTRRLQFGSAVHRFVAHAYLDMSEQLREAGQLDACARALTRAGDQIALAMTFTDAMHKMNQTPALAGAAE